MNPEKPAARLDAFYFDGRTSKRHNAVIESHGEHVTIAGEFGERHERWRHIQIAEAVGNAPRRISLADGAYCEIHDSRAFAIWMQGARLKPSLVEGMQQHWHWVALSLAGAVAFLAAGYLWLLPIAAQALVPKIPPLWAQSISARVMQGLDNGILSASTLPEEHRERIRAKVTTLAYKDGPYRLIFRSAHKTANAFALPNGDIVILDELVNLADSDDEVTAVVAHELGHVAHHHGLRQLIQASVVSAVVGYYFGDVSSLATGLASLALDSRYSREFEAESDRFAVDLMRASGMNPTLLATMLERLEKQEPQNRQGRTFSSHPETAQRIMMLRQHTGG